MSLQGSLRTSISSPPPSFEAGMGCRGRGAWFVGDVEHHGTSGNSGKLQKRPAED